MVDQSAGGWCCTPPAGILTPDWDFGVLRHGRQREGGTSHTGSHMIPCTPYCMLRDTCRPWPHQSHSAGDAGCAAVQNLSPSTEVLLLEWAADLQRQKTDRMCENSESRTPTQIVWITCGVDDTGGFAPVISLQWDYAHFISLSWCKSAKINTRGLVYPAYPGTGLIYPQSSRGRVNWWARCDIITIRWVMQGSGPTEG